VSETILVAVAWPYANSEIHVGNLVGSYLPADIFARYHRLKGNKVLMVSGTDSHGTPVTVRADADGVTPLDVYLRFHAGFLELFKKLGLTYDIFTTTHTSNHFSISQHIFLSLKENGYLHPDRQLQWYSPKLNRFLPDRYVEGTCYICGYPNARSDQCDKCGNLLDPTKLIDPRTRIDGSTPELRETEHFFLDLEKLQGWVVEFLKQRESYWRQNVLRQSLGQIEAEGLHGRPITRDLDWGIPVPVEGWKGKCLYVWFEAVIGYLSSAIEWSQIVGKKDAWRDWWIDPQAKTFYFIGKDNIPFHAIIWPAELIGCGTSFDQKMGTKDPQPLVLPFDVPANEFLNLEGQKISGSRNWAIWGLDFLSRSTLIPCATI
jgi:methionyl-tRNA synthetase